MKIRDIGDAGMRRNEADDLSHETVLSNEHLRKDGVKPMMTARASRDIHLVTIVIVGTAIAIAVIHLVETATDTQEETHVSAVPPMLPTNPAHLQLTEDAKAHLALANASAGRGYLLVPRWVLINAHGGYL